MIDLHSHLLYGLDDGAKTPEETASMLDAYAAQGVREVAATSHAEGCDGTLYEQRFAEVAALAAEKGIKLHGGIEHSLRSAENADAKTIGGSNFILIDVGAMPPGINTQNFFRRINSAGLKIILAHPERLWGENAISILDDLDHFQIYAQLNAGSLLGIYGKNTCTASWKLLERGYCRVIASDAHQTSMIRFLELRDRLSRYYPPDTIDKWLAGNPAKILENRPPSRVFLPLSWWKRLQLHLSN